MKLWHCTDARSFRVLWALEELGLDYELELMPFPPRFRAREFLDVNPLGTIPYFEDGTAKMTESAAIVEYLAARHGDGSLSVAVDAPDYGAYLNWLHHGEATLTFPQTIVLRYRVLEPPERRQPTVADDYAVWFEKRTLAVAAVVERSDYLCDGRFTAADISVGYAILLAEHLGLTANLAPSLLAYWQRLQARDGFKRAKAAQARP